MKGLACPWPALPGFGHPGSCFMAEGSSCTQAPGQGPPISIQLLRAQYEGLKRQQRTQIHLLVLPKGGHTHNSAESMISPVWINKEARSSLSLEEADSKVEGVLEEADRGGLQTPESPWHTHLEMHRLVQTFHHETSQVKPKGQPVGSDQRLRPEGDPHLFENRHPTLPGTKLPEAAQGQCQVGGSLTKIVGPSLKTNIQFLPSIKDSHRSGRPAYYPFPRRKTPRISEAARNLGLYGPT
ncbi:uncharacterized protein C9orf152 homolog [Marmota flaviventris]|uniref:uncharacterized protein C9orf152 homolog n=1 Tax=Marmota flaviventris TaxID=93162 RepID=UPI000FFFC153|nr:uncharacterized protein C9orf152 homolog [Marmota flaviventris]